MLPAYHSSPYFKGILSYWKRHHPNCGEFALMTNDFMFVDGLLSTLEEKIKWKTHHGTLHPIRVCPWDVVPSWWHHCVRIYHSNACTNIVPDHLWKVFLYEYVWKGTPVLCAHAIHVRPSRQVTTTKHSKPLQTFAKPPNTQSHFFVAVWHAQAVQNAEALTNKASAIEQSLSWWHNRKQNLKPNPDSGQQDFFEWSAQALVLLPIFRYRYSEKS